MCRSVQLLPPPRKLYLNFHFSVFLKGRFKKSPFFFKFPVAFFLYNRITDINTLILNYG